MSYGGNRGYGGNGGCGEQLQRFVSYGGNGGNGGYGGNGGCGRYGGNDGYGGNGGYGGYSTSSSGAEHSGRRCQDGSLDMRCSENRGHSKYG